MRSTICCSLYVVNCTAPINLLYMHCYGFANLKRQCWILISYQLITILQKVRIIFNGVTYFRYYLLYKKTTHGYSIDSLEWVERILALILFFFPFLSCSKDSNCDLAKKKKECTWIKDHKFTTNQQHALRFSFS
jgi:hypothetical protein